MTSTINFDSHCSLIRTSIKNVGTEVLLLKDSISSTFGSKDTDFSEMFANVTLAYRHLEDAAMRVGKAIQAYEGGKGIYDNKDASRAAQVAPTAQTPGVSGVDTAQPKE